MNNYCFKCDKECQINHTHCPKCDSPPESHEIRNYSMMWHDGDIHCTICNTYVRSYDAG